MVQTLPIRITLISDATGSLGEHVLQAVLTQFPPGAFEIQTTSFVNTQKRFETCLEKLRQTRGLVVHATIYKDFKQQIELVCHQKRLPVLDLTGPVMAFLVEAFGRRPRPDYKKLHELNADYFKRIVAIEFAIEHDDARGLHTLGQADVMLTGVSRTTKTPTSMALAMYGIRAANIPIVPDLKPPKELLALAPHRVICLTLSPSSLSSIRAARVKTELGFDGGYTDQEAIAREVRRARQLSEQHGWRILDVTGWAVEETAAHVLRGISSRKRTS